MGGGNCSSNQHRGKICYDISILNFIQIMSGTLNDPSANRYSRLNDMELFRNEGDRNRFTFALRYPGHDPGYFVWKQQVNPFLADGG